MLTLVILPGLDGTTRLLSDFMVAARPSFDSVLAVSYPGDRVLRYNDLEAIVRDALPREGWFVLLGESFSGPVALTIAADPPAGLVGLVLSTTFAKNPVFMLRPFADLARFAPVQALPLAVLSWWLLGPWATPPITMALRDALQSVAPSVLSARASMALRVDVTECLRRIAIPVLYLRATKDRLLDDSAGNTILKALPATQLTRIAGPHLLLQTFPTQAAAAVTAFIADLRQSLLSLRQAGGEPPVAIAK